MEVPELTTSDIYKFLRNHLGQDITDVSRIGQGEWSLAYSFRDKNSEMIIRFSHLDADFAKDRFAANFASPQLPIPKVIDIGKALGGFYAVSEKADGGAIDYLNPEEMHRILPSLFDLLDALRLADTSKTIGYGGWNADGNGSYENWREALLDIACDRPTDRINGWKAKLAASSVGMDVFDKAYQQLVSSVDVCPEERHLIHADLLHFNLLVADDQVTSVLDWGCAKYGDFLYELAWFSFWSPWFPSMKGIDFRKESLRHYAKIGLEVSDFEERIRCYEIHIGLDSLAYGSFRENWDFVGDVAKHTLEVMK